MVAPAEDLPFPDAHFDLLTLCAALHWLDARVFFREARRVLRPEGQMAIDPFFGGDGERTFVFGGPIWYFVKARDSSGISDAQETIRNMG